MLTQPTLQTPRLTLRPFTLADAPEVQRLAGTYEVASTTLHIPHPYEDGMAEQWISTHRPAFEEGTSVTYAVVLCGGNALCGAISLRINARHAHAELGYWIGVPYWGQGYCTEAARTLLVYGFESHDLHRIYATHLTRNPASGRVMQKIGMTYEGRRREHVQKWGVFEDLEMYAILRQEWEALARPKGQVEVARRGD